VATKISDINPSVQALFNNADAFHRSATLLYEQTDGEHAGSFLVPSYVLFAFSLELYFKCISTIAVGRASRGHDLLELYKSTGHANKARLQELYAASIKGGLTKRLQFKTALEEVGAEVPHPEDLEAVLRASKDAFSQLRYIHERADGGAFLAGAALSATRSLIFELEPALAERYAP
jgi:hypothetical protein